MSAPVIQDCDITLGESGAIVEYILTKNGKGKLVIPPSAPNYADYLYFLHFANAYFQSGLVRYRAVQAAGGGAGDPESISVKLAKRAFELSLKLIDERTTRTGKWLAGDEFTAADVMIVFSLTTMRYFAPYSLDGYHGILAYLKRVGQREAYRRAYGKGRSWV